MIVEPLKEPGLETNEQKMTGRLGKRRRDDAEDDLRCMNVRGWIRLCGERTEWKKITDEAKIHAGLRLSLIHI